MDDAEGWVSNVRRRAIIGEVGHEQVSKFVEFHVHQAIIESRLFGEIAATPTAIARLKTRLAKGGASLSVELERTRDEFASASRACASTRRIGGWTGVATERRAKLLAVQRRSKCFFYESIADIIACLT